VSAKPDRLGLAPGRLGLKRPSLFVIVAAVLSQALSVAGATDNSSPIDEILAGARQAYSGATNANAVQDIQKACETKVAAAVRKEREKLTSNAVSLLSDDKFDDVDKMLKRERELDEMGQDFRERACRPPLSDQARAPDPGPPAAETAPAARLAAAEAAAPDPAPSPPSIEAKADLGTPSPRDDADAEKRAASETDRDPPAAAERLDGAASAGSQPSAPATAGAPTGEVSKSDEPYEAPPSPELTPPSLERASGPSRSVESGAPAKPQMSALLTPATKTDALPPPLTSPAPPPSQSAVDAEIRLAAVEREVDALAAELRTLKREQAPRPTQTAANEPSPPAASDGPPGPDFLAALVTALPEGMPPRVLIRYAGRSAEARRRAEELASALAAQGLEVADLRESVVAPAQTRLSFSYASDEAVASRIGRLAGVAPQRQALPKDGLLPRPGTVELILAGQ
jgi:hypothetical protein